MAAIDNSITICSVNWHSSALLEELFRNLISKAEKPERLQFLIIDNTNGQDNLEKINNNFQNVTIINNNPGRLKGSLAHSSGLNIGMKNIKTPYALILDPDVHIFKKNWDSFLISILNRNIIAAGTVYPDWQLGKYHNFPNPVFCFFKTDDFLKFQPDWTPFARNKLFQVWDFIRRNILRFSILINRNAYGKYAFVRKIWPSYEKLIGVCSKDTGWKNAKKAKQLSIGSELFKAVLANDKLPQSESDSYKQLASQFELYYYKNEPILTHKYSTSSAVWKTQKGFNMNFWRECIDEFEKNIAAVQQD